MSKFKTPNNQIPGLFRDYSPVRCGKQRGVSFKNHRKIAVINVVERVEGGIRFSPVQGFEQFWALDLRDITGAFHAAMYIDDHFAKLEAHGVKIGHDLDTVLGDGATDPMARGLYYAAYGHASDGKPLTTEERKALTRIVLWVAERVG